MITLLSTMLKGFRCWGERKMAGLIDYSFKETPIPKALKKPSCFKEIYYYTSTYYTVQCPSWFDRLHEIALVSFRLYVYVYIYICTHTHIYTYVRTCIYVCTLLRVYYSIETKRFISITVNKKKNNNKTRKIRNKKLLSIMYGKTEFHHYLACNR